MIENVKNFLTSHKPTVILVAILILIVFGGIFAFQKITASKQATGPVEEIDLDFDAEGPYAILSPRRDGYAVILNLKRTASYDSITYELVYTSSAEEAIVEGGKVKNLGEKTSGDGDGVVIDRAVQGTIDTKDGKGEYEQEILFGSCSKNVCKYDQGVENGTLVLHVKKGNKAYRMNTQWHLQKPDIALGTLTSGDNHLTYTTKADREDLSNLGFTIINDLTGVPKLPSGKTVLGKVYSLNTPIAKSLPVGEVSFELAENPPSDAKLFRFDPNKSQWQELKSSIDGSTLKSQVDGAGIFAVLVED